MTASEDIHFEICRIEDMGLGKAENQRIAVARLLEGMPGAPCRLAHNPDGAPFLLDSRLEISISHSRHFAAVAWSEHHRPGIDVEEPRPEQLGRVARRYLTPAEFEHYSSESAALLKAWTLKEAAFKALPHGPADLRQISLPLDAADNIIRYNEHRLEIQYSQFMESGAVFVSIVKLI